MLRKIDKYISATLEIWTCVEIIQLPANDQNLDKYINFKKRSHHWNRLNQLLKIGKRHKRWLATLVRLRRMKLSDGGCCFGACWRLLASCKLKNFSKPKIFPKRAKFTCCSVSTASDIHWSLILNWNIQNIDCKKSFNKKTKRSVS